MSFSRVEPFRVDAATCHLMQPLTRSSLYSPYNYTRTLFLCQTALAPNCSILVSISSKLGSLLSIYWEKYFFMALKTRYTQVCLSPVLLLVLSNNAKCQVHAMLCICEGDISAFSPTIQLVGVFLTVSAYVTVQRVHISIKLLFFSQCFSHVSIDFVWTSSLLGILFYFFDKLVHMMTEIPQFFNLNYVIRVTKVLDPSFKG